MEMNQIKNLNNEVVTDKQYEEIAESEFVTEIEDCGMSGNKIGYHWWNVILSDGEELNIYTK